MDEVYFSIKIGGRVLCKGPTSFYFYMGTICCEEESGDMTLQGSNESSDNGWPLICICAIGWMDLRNIYDKVQQIFKTDNIWAGKKIKIESD